MFIFLILGILAGAALDTLIFFKVNTVFYYWVVILSFLSYGLCYNQKNNGRLILTSLGLAILVSLPFLLLILPEYAMSHQLILSTKSEDDRMMAFIFVFPVFIYMAHSFHYAYHYENTWRWSYRTLFSAVWDSWVLFAAASIFAGIAQFLIVLAAVIFKTVGSELLWNAYFDNIYFFVPVNSILFFVGLSIAHQNQKTIHNLRFLLLKMMQILFPLLAIVSIIYFGLFIVSLFQPHDLYRFPPEVLFCILMVLGVVFFNAYFQTGEEEGAYSSRLKNILKVYRLVLLCLSVMFTWNMFRLTTLPLNVCLYFLIGNLYCLLYAITVFFSQEKQRLWITTGNQVIALFFIGMLLLLNNPFYPINGYLGQATTKVHVQT